jgi:hypothetical protein
MKVKIDEEALTEALAASLLWSAEHAESKKLRKALYRSASYYMTYPECVKYFGEEQTREYWDEC